MNDPEKPYHVTFGDNLKKEGNTSGHKTKLNLFSVKKL